MTAIAARTLDPALFDPASIDAETRAFNAELERQLASIPTIVDVPPQVVRDARAAGTSLFGPVVRLPHGRDLGIPGPAGPVPLRVFVPERPRGVMLHIHGGGWALGAHDLQDPALDTIAASTGLAVASVGYRLAPEHPYPAGPDDCEAAALWLAANAHREFGAELTAIGGESAGAHLSVVTMLRLRDRHRLRPFRAAILTYGGFDLDLTPSARNWGSRNLILSTPILRQFADWFAPAAWRDRPDVSPLYADLHGLPPALFSVGTLDPLLDDSLFMAARWSAAGNAAELAVYPGGIHAFNAFPLALGTRANRRIGEFLAPPVAHR
jgi:acetyl esterase/lipase